MSVNRFSDDSLVRKIRKLLRKKCFLYMADFYSINYVYTIPHFLKYVRMHSYAYTCGFWGTTLC